MHAWEGCSSDIPHDVTVQSYDVTVQSYDVTVQSYDVAVQSYGLSHQRKFQTCPCDSIERILMRSVRFLVWDSLKSNSDCSYHPCQAPLRSRMGKETVPVNIAFLK